MFRRHYRNKIEYLPEALVLDEKVQKSEVFANQRKRWLSAQFVYFRRFAVSGIKELLFKGNVDFADKVYQMVSPPRVLLLGMVTLITVIYFLLEFVFQLQDLWIPASYWYLIMGLTVCSFLLSIPKKFYGKDTINAILALPKAFGVMFLSLFKLKGANKKFIHTQHGAVNT